MKKKNLYAGFTGFLGFLGFRYFSSGNIIDLGFFIFFAFFSNFFLARIQGDKADERYMENSKQAKAFAFDITTALILFCWFLSVLSEKADFLYIALPIIYAAALNIYGIKLYRLEEK